MESGTIVKKFRLKKDMPFIRAGEFFKYSEEKARFLCVDEVGGEVFYSHCDLIKNKEFFEPYYDK